MDYLVEGLLKPNRQNSFNRGQASSPTVLKKESEMKGI